MVITRTLLGLYCWFPGLLLNPFLAYKTYLAAGGVPQSWEHAFVVFAALFLSGFVGKKLLE